MNLKSNFPYLQLICILAIKSWFWIFYQKTLHFVGNNNLPRSEGFFWQFPIIFGCLTWDSEVDQINSPASWSISSTTPPRYKPVLSVLVEGHRGRAGADEVPGEPGDGGHAGGDGGVAGAGRGDSSISSGSRLTSSATRSLHSRQSQVSTPGPSYRQTGSQSHNTGKFKHPQSTIIITSDFYKLWTESFQ